MTHIEFFQDLRDKAETSPIHKPESRPFKNAQGATVLITLPKSYWEYVAWLEIEADIDFQDWVLHCEANPWEHMSLSHLLMYWLWFDECARHRDGHPTPTDTPPHGYEPYGCAGNDNLHGGAAA